MSTSRSDGGAQVGGSGQAPREVDPRAPAATGDRPPHQQRLSRRRSRPSAIRRARAGACSGRSSSASTRASSAPVRMASTVARLPRSRPSASTRMLLPAPVSPVITVSPGPKESSSSSMRAKPEMRSKLSTRALSATPASPLQQVLRGERLLAAATAALAPGELLAEQAEEAPWRLIEAQGLVGPPDLDRTRVGTSWPHWPSTGQGDRAARIILDLEASVRAEHQRAVRQHVGADRRHHHRLDVRGQDGPARPRACRRSSRLASTTISPSAL